MGEIQNFVFLDCLMTEKWLDPILFPDDFKDEAYTPNFKQNGYESKNAIRNMGSSFVYLVGIISGLIFYPISKLISLKVST